VSAEQINVALIGPNQIEQHPNGGGFPGAVWSQETVDLTGGHFQVEVFQRVDALARAPAEVFMQIFDTYGD